MGRRRIPNMLDGIEYPRPGYCLEWEYDMARMSWRLRLGAPFPHPDDEFAEPRQHYMERSFPEETLERGGLIEDADFRIHVVRDTIHALERSVADQWLIINGRPYSASSTSRDQAVSREWRL